MSVFASVVVCVNVISYALCYVSLTLADADDVFVGTLNIVYLGSSCPVVPQLIHVRLHPQKLNFCQGAALSIDVSLKIF